MSIRTTLAKRVARFARGSGKSHLGAGPARRHLSSRSLNVECLEQRALLTAAPVGDALLNDLLFTAGNGAPAPGDSGEAGTRVLVFDLFDGTWSDAEKDSTSTEDDDLCWAATASNMLEWTAWGFVNNMFKADQFLDYFEEHWKDVGQFTQNALTWWFDGAGTYGGDVDVAGGGFHPTYNPATYVHVEPNDANVMSFISQYTALGSGMGVWVHDGFSHEVTVWGYNYDPAYTPADPEYYLGLWITDSDDNKGHPNANTAPNDLHYYTVEWDDTNSRWMFDGYDAAAWLEEAVALDRYSNGVITVNGDQDSVDQADNINVALDATGMYLEVRINGALEISTLFSQVSEINVLGWGGNDNLTVDWANGNPIPVGGFFYDGGTGGDDALTVIGDGSGSGSYLPAPVAGEGTVNIGGSAIHFTGLEPVIVNGLSELTFITPNSNDVLTIDSPAAGQNRVSGTSGGVPFEALTFLNVGHVKVDAATNDTALGSPNDSVTFTSDLVAAGLVSFTVETGDGNDTITATPVTAMPLTLLAGAGDDTITGGSGADRIDGGAGNDVAVGGPGADRFFGGDDSDVFTWNPGDGSDLLEGGANEADRLVFNGSAAVETFHLYADTVDPSRFSLFRDVGSVLMDVAGFEEIDLSTLGGVDQITVGRSQVAGNPLSTLETTDVKVVDINVGGEDGAADIVNVDGRTVADHIAATVPAAGLVAIEGLPYDINIAGAALPDDLLAIRGNEGDDAITTGAGLEGVIRLNLAGDAGADTLDVSATVANALASVSLDGGAGDDLLIGGAGNETMDGSGGDDTFVGNGGTDAVGGGVAGLIGDTIRVLGTPGSDIISLVLNASGHLLATINGLTTTFTNFIGGPIAASSVERIAVDGGAGADQLTVDSTNGAIPIFVSYDGGADSDSLVLTGGTATSNVYSPGPNPGQGTSTAVIGGVTQTVSFSNIEPLVDLVAGPLAVNATPADNAISYAQTPGDPTRGRVTVDNLEYIDFSAKTTLTINALGGSDTISLNNASTPTGLTGITVNGGDPSGSDRLVVNGAAATVSVTLDTQTIAGATGAGGAVPVVFGAIEELHVTAGASTTLSLSNTSGANPIEYIYTPGAAVDAGTIQNSVVPVSFTGFGAGAVLDFNGDGLDGNDSLVVNGTGAIDHFVVAGATSDVTLTTAGLARAQITHGNIENLTLNGLGADDRFFVTGAVSLTSLLLDGGGPSGSDAASLTADGASPATLTFSAIPGTAALSGGGLSGVSVAGMEIVDLDAGGVAPTIAATGGDDDVTVTVLTADAGKVERGLAVQQAGQVQGEILAPTVNYSNTGAGGVNIDLDAGEDTLVVVGNASPQTFAVGAAAVSIDDAPNGVGSDGLVNFSHAESLAVFGLEGNDRFDVTPVVIPIFVDGGDPIGTTAGDLINIIFGGLVMFEAGPEVDEGGFVAGGNARVSFDHIEEALLDATCALIVGTNADDDITVIARNQLANPAQFAGADGFQDFTTSVNNGIQILWLDTPNLYIDARGGDDDIVLRTRAPNAADWDVDVRVVGGPPSAATGAQGDVVEVETPYAIDSVFWRASGSETGELLLDEDGDGVYSQLSSDSRIQILSEFLVDCDGDLVNEYRSSPGGVEGLVYDGEAGNDRLTVAGTASADTIVHTPGSAADEGAVRVDLLLGIAYQNLGATAVLTVDGGAGADRLVARGTAGSDSLAVAATSGAVTLSSAIGAHLAIQTASVANLTLDAFEGDDRFVINNPQAYGEIRIEGGGPGHSDVLTVNGAAAVDEAFSVSPGFANGDGTVSVNLLAVPYTGIEHVLLDANAGDADTLLVNDDSADNLWLVKAGPTVGDRIQIDARESIDYDDFQDVTLTNGFGVDRFEVHPTDLIGFSGTFTVNGNAATPIDDVLELVATDGNDSVTSTATAVAVNGVAITAGANLAELRVRTLGGDDVIDLDLNLAGVRKTIDAGEGNDIVDMSGTVDANIFGGDGDDYLIGSPLADFIDGGRGNDTLIALAGADVLYGGEGDDILDGDAGADQMFGGDGSDTFLWDPGDGSDLIEGGAGDVDVMAFNGSSGDEVFTLNAVGGRLEFLRSLGSIDMDVADVEQVDVNRDFTFTAVLDQAQEVPAPIAVPGAAGTATMRFNSANNTFDLDLFVQGLSGPITSSHLHVAPPGAAGPAVVNLGDQTAYIASGGGFRRIVRGLAFPAANIADLLSGNIYVNVHTALNPAGEIRSQMNLAAANATGADTFVVNDITQTDVRVVNLNLGADGLAAGDQVTVNGRTVADDILITAAAGAVNVAGLEYDVNVRGSVAAETDRLVVNGNDDDDRIKAAAGVEATILITLNGGLGDDQLSADALLIGGPGDDFLEGGAGADVLQGGPGEDTLIGGGGADLIDGGEDFDTILVRGTLGNDLIDVFQPAPPVVNFTLNVTVGGVLDVDTIVAAGAVPSVEQVLIEASAGDDLIRVGVADAYTDLNLANGVAAQTLRFTVHGGEPNASDRLIVRDDGLGDLVLYRKGTDGRSGSVTVGAAAPVVFSEVERLDVTPLDNVDINGNGDTGTDGQGRLIVFAPDPFELNDTRRVSTAFDFLSRVAVHPTIDPGGIPNAFGPGQNVPGDEDWFEFVAPKTSTFRFDLLFEAIPVLANGREGLPGDGELTLEIYGINSVTNNLELLASGLPIPADGGVYAPIGTEAGQSYFARVRGAIPLGENVSAAVNLYDLQIVETDLFGPQVVDVYISAVPAYNLFGDAKPISPTPLTRAITIDIIDRPGREPGFLYEALNEAIASQPGHYLLVGDHSGVIPIQEVIVTNLPVLAPINGTLSAVTNAGRFASTTAALLDVNDDHVGATLRFTSGALAGEERFITDYIVGPGATRTFVFQDPFPALPAVGDNFILVSPAEARIQLIFEDPGEFATALADDRFTLTIADNLVDPPGNNLDGESNAIEPHAQPSFRLDLNGDGLVDHSGDGVPGGDFVARFTIDTRAEIAVWAAGSIYVDGNGNFLFDTQNSDDFTNRDFSFTLGFASDYIFAGNFATNLGAAADGFAKIAAYGLIGNSYRWLIDTNNDSVVDAVRTESLSVIGVPVAGNFDGNAANGDEIGLFTGTQWWLDTDHDFLISDQSPLPAVPSAANPPAGLPIVGDFDGDGIDDLGVWHQDVFSVDLSSIGGITGITDRRFNFGLIGVRERPIAADFDGDRIDDIGLWVPDRGGATDDELGEWLILISDGRSIVDRIVPDPDYPPGTFKVAFTPLPLGRDIFAQFGDEFAVPLVGNFDPPIGSASASIADTMPTTGTAGNDELLITPAGAGQWNVTLRTNIVGGVAETEQTFLIDDSSLTVNFNGLGGDDTINIVLTSGREQIKLNSTGGSVVGDGFTIDLAPLSVENYLIDAAGNKTDVAQLYGTAAADEVTATDSWVELVGPGYHLRVDNAEYVHAYPMENPTVNYKTDTAIDKAYLYDSYRSERFKADELQGVLTGTDRYRRARYFDEVYAHFDNGGNDQAVFEDTKNNDLFEARNGLAKLSSGNLVRQVEGDFSKVTAWARAGRSRGVDELRLTGSMSNDTLRVLASKTEIYDTPENYRIIGRLFEKLYVDVGAQGFDRAFVWGTAGDERVEAQATNRHVMMYDINGVDPRLLAELLQFDHVRITGNGGSDEADPAPGTFPWLEILP